MPPKVKITKEEIIEAALRIVRESGDEALNARNVAAALGCSTQPVFSNFPSMVELRLAVVERADMLYESYIKEEIESEKYPAYKASGMAYIRFAVEEKQLFRLLYMRDRTDERNIELSDGTKRILSMIQKTTGFDEETTKLFHLEVWAFVHGIATMLATGFEKLDFDLISAILTDVYQGLLKRFKEKE